MTTAVGVARVVLDELGGGADSYKLQKLVYYCQAWHTTQTRRALFDGVIEAWKNGPVAADLWPVHKGRYWVRSDMLPVDALDTSVDEFARDVIRAVVAHYGPMDSQALVELTHTEAPWRNVFRPGRNSTITPGEMRAYYGALLAEGGHTPDLPNAGIHYVTDDDFALLASEAEDDSVNVGLAAALVRARARSLADGRSCAPSSSIVWR